MYMFIVCTNCEIIIFQGFSMFKVVTESWHQQRVWIYTYLVKYMGKLKKLGPESILRNILSSSHNGMQMYVLP